MLRTTRTPLGLLAALSLLPGCAYLDDFKEGDPYILILIAALVVMMGFFGAISQGKTEVLDRNITQVQQHKDALHEAEDQIRVQRDRLYVAQQELLGHMERLLTEKQKSDPSLRAMRRKLLELERDVLTAEGKRNSLRGKEPVA